jgi:hypothetical protein
MRPCVVLLLGPSSNIEGQHPGRVWTALHALCCLVCMSWLYVLFVASLALSDGAYAALPAQPCTACGPRNGCWRCCCCHLVPA